MTISTSADPVGAPIFYRNVPLRTSAPLEDGPIAWLPQSAIPLINWEIRNISEPESHVVMEKLSTCANCHSFSRDGKTFGLDMDGPKNDKGPIRTGSGLEEHDHHPHPGHDPLEAPST